MSKSLAIALALSSALAASRAKDLRATEEKQVLRAFGAQDDNRARSVETGRSKEKGGSAGGRIAHRTAANRYRW
jgi:hypothetical protein